MEQACCGSWKSRWYIPASFVVSLSLLLSFSASFSLSFLAFISIVLVSLARNTPGAVFSSSRIERSAGWVSGSASLDVSRREIGSAQTRSRLSGLRPLLPDANLREVRELISPVDFGVHVVNVSSVECRVEDIVETPMIAGEVALTRNVNVRVLINGSPDRRRPLSSSSSSS